MGLRFQSLSIPPVIFSHWLSRYAHLCKAPKNRLKKKPSCSCVWFHVFFCSYELFSLCFHFLKQRTVTGNDYTSLHILNLNLSVLGGHFLRERVMETVCSVFPHCSLPLSGQPMSCHCQCRAAERFVSYGEPQCWPSHHVLLLCVCVWVRRRFCLFARLTDVWLQRKWQ